MNIPTYEEYINMRDDAYYQRRLEAFNDFQNNLITQKEYDRLKEQTFWDFKAAITSSAKRLNYVFKFKEQAFYGNMFICHPKINPWLDTNGKRVAKADENCYFYQRCYEEFPESNIGIYDDPLFKKIIDELFETYTDFTFTPSYNQIIFEYKNKTIKPKTPLDDIEKIQEATNKFSQACKDAGEKVDKATERLRKYL